MMEEQTIQERKSALINFVENRLPDAAKMAKPDNRVVILHQDSFAADYQDEEYELLGKFIKYLGLSGNEIHIIGKNRETLKDK
jgi:hypothetical protein